MAAIKKARNDATLTAKLPTVQVTPEMRNEVENIASEDEVTLGDVVREALKEFIVRRRKKEKGSK
jgi:hypothetical protein